MYNSEKTANRQNKWVSLLICWLIILGGYLLIRMVFLIFGLQLHLAAQGACLVLLPFIFGALYLRKCCKKQKPWFYVLGLLLPAVAEKLTLYFLGAYLCGISPLRVTAVMEAIGRTEPYAVLLLVCTDGVLGPYQSTENFKRSFVRPVVRRILDGKINEVKQFVCDLGLRSGIGDDVSLAMILKDSTRLRYYR